MEQSLIPVTFLGTLTTALNILFISKTSGGSILRFYRLSALVLHVSNQSYDAAMEGARIRRCMCHAGRGGDYIGLLLWAQAWALPHVPLAARES